MERLINLAYALFGVVFSIIGILTLLTAAEGWHATGVILWGALGFILLDVSAAYGFFLRAQWLLPGFMLNALGILALWFLDPVSLRANIALGGASALLLFLYFTKNQTKKTPGWQGVAFVLLWGMVFFYSLFHN
ncbi:MAG: hypothetical protein G01um101456_720 [Parcubacteria group bacterium Gr01-1014_56]|nr:MAG: hypothetical protein G01um101456_720 [Parcubacteria group bacterium Gr01-1014_56]